MAKPAGKVAFSTSQPILSGFIYVIRQKSVKKVVSKGSLERMGLEGEWEVLRTFENKDK